MRTNLKLWALMVILAAAAVTILLVREAPAPGRTAALAPGARALAMNSVSKMTDKQTATIAAGQPLPLDAAQPRAIKTATFAFG